MLDARHWQMLGMLVLDNLEIGNSRARSMLDFFNARPITITDSCDRVRQKIIAAFLYDCFFFSFFKDLKKNLDYCVKLREK